MRNYQYDIAIIGIGRVGLPLSIVLSSKGFLVVGIDKDEKIIEKVNDKEFPFHEPGCEDLIKEVDLLATSDMSVVGDCKNIIITVGTPLLSHIETDLSNVIEVLDSIMPYLKKGHNLILRSTLAPRTTNFVKHYINKNTDHNVGKDIFLSFCPERIAEGKSLVELESLPQIIGSEDRRSAEMAEEIFSKLTKEIFHTDYISAELVKLFNNIARYINFSIANQFTMIAENYGSDIYDIIHMANHNYPRAVIPSPGFTAGTCLRKDFGMINEDIPYTDLLLSAWKINEFVPKFLVKGIGERVTILGKTISVLGYTFKQDVDDTRDSLVPKLIRYLFRENPSSIFVSDPFLGSQITKKISNTDPSICIPQSDIIIVATNHSQYQKDYSRIFQLCKPGTWIVDIWNISQSGKIFIEK